MRYRDYRSNSTACAPTAFERCTSWLHHFDKVVENAVGYVLVENSFVSEFLQIKLEALKLDTL